MPTSGRSTNPASGAPTRAPDVLARVSHAAARVSWATARRIPLPISVKKRPDRSDAGAVSTHANQRILRHSPTCVPDVSDSKLPYEAITAQAASSDTTAAVRSEARLDQTDPINPPMAMPASTTASIRLAASVVLSTYIVRKRNQTTSSASSVKPERNAAIREKRRRDAESAELAATFVVGRPEDRPLPKPRCGGRASAVARCVFDCE